MTRKQIFTAVAAVLIAAGCAFGVWSSYQQRPTHHSTTTSAPYREPTVKPVAPAATPTPTPTTSANQDPSPDGGDQMVDLTALKATAAAAARAYITYDSAEPAAARTARLAPLFAAGSPALTSRPELANPTGINYSDYTAEVQVTDISTVGFDSVPADGKTWVMAVFVTYRGDYTLGGQKQTRVDRAEWKVTMPASAAATQALSIDEPPLPQQ